MLSHRLYDSNAPFAARLQQRLTVCIKRAIQRLQTNMFSLHVFHYTPLRPSTRSNNWDNNDDDACRDPTIELTTFHKGEIVAIEQQKELQVARIKKQARQRLQQEEREPHSYMLRLDDIRVCYTYCEIFTISEEERPEFECYVHSEVRNEPLPYHQYEDI